ncbi:MAG: nucleotide exchange factor GrpE [Candidatus Azambacteria bacterium]|nr:nucleotide exchange factor GrpE [Candidatus Azambacteria bacterium]
MEEKEQEKKEEELKLLEEAWAEVAMLREKLAQSEKEREEFLDLSRRMKADLANVKKDQEKAMAGYVQLAITESLLKFFPVIDSFDLAVKHLPKDLEENAWAKGIISIKKQLDGVLKDMGVTSVPTVGEPFSPDMHDAIEHEESDKDDGIILEEYQRGYMVKGKVIRPATVKISQKK